MGIRKASILVLIKDHLVKLNEEKMIPKTAIVVTTINSPNQVMNKLADIAKRDGILFVVVGDKKTPDIYESYECAYLSVNRQNSLYPVFSRNLPLNHYSRKNVGYLYAIMQGVDRIVETDDDNLPGDNFLSREDLSVLAQHTDVFGWVNIYKYFSEDIIWPRGYPLEFINTPHQKAEIHIRRVLAPIQQGLADGNPDVDAIYRMTRKLPIIFKKIGSLSLGVGAWCPFNSQNTTWFREAFPLMYLPSFCSFRMTDIWRSFIAQRILWECESSLVFHDATVWQDRNEHNLLKDFSDEIPGYVNNEIIRNTLNKLILRKGLDHVCENLLSCYEELIKIGVISVEERELIHAWVRCFENA
jgi:hypothetical protein